MEEVPPLVSKELKLQEKGTIRVKGVLPGFPAAKGGLKPGDIIVALEGKALPLGDPLSFFRQRIMEVPVGAKITLEFVRYSERTGEPAVGGSRPTQHLTLTLEVAAKPKAD
jgi:S1-C subfamily serine protease